MSDSFPHSTRDLNKDNEHHSIPKSQNDYILASHLKLNCKIRRKEAFKAKSPFPSHLSEENSPYSSYLFRKTAFIFRNLHDMSENVYLEISC